MVDPAMVLWVITPKDSSHNGFTTSFSPGRGEILYNAEQKSYTEINKQNGYDFKVLPKGKEIVFDSTRKEYVEQDSEGYNEISHHLYALAKKSILKHGNYKTLGELLDSKGVI